MKKQDNQPDDLADIREHIIGLGEKSIRKSYYPELQEKLVDLERFKTLLDQSNDAIFLTNVPSGRLLYVSKSAYTQIGYTESECYSLTMYDIVPENVGELDRILSAKTDSIIFDALLLKRSGEKRPYELNMHMVTFKNRKYVVAVARDTTERKNADEALRESERRFRQLADFSPMPIALYDVNENINYLNSKFIETFGYTLEDIPDLNSWWPLAYPDPAYRQEILEKWTRHVENAVRELKEITPMEAMVTCKDGSIRYIEFYGTIIGNQKMVILQDITEHKQAEKELINAKTQAELYLDIMGHDINNINQTAMGFLEIADNKLHEDGKLCIEDSELLTRPIESLKNSAKLIENLRKIQKEKSHAYKIESISVNEFLNDVIKQFSPVAGRDVKINFQPACECDVLANPLLKDVFSNLVGNAIKHSKGSLTINISTSVVHAYNKLCCRISIEDNGLGIPDERKASLFDFSKAIRQKIAGKGLGLYLVKTLVDDFHGKLMVEDRVPADHTKGARFVVMLPVAE